VEVLVKVAMLRFVMVKIFLLSLCKWNVDCNTAFLVVLLSKELFDFQGSSV